jgi:RNA polymerase sigma factor (sigma-70 family)
LRKRHGKKPLLVACDVYRPAAVKQLQVVGEQVDTPVFEHGLQNPVETATLGIKYAISHGCDVVILDTAGRLHIDEELMGELDDIKRLTTPDEILLVVDAMTGQDAVNVAESFNKRLDISGVLMTKFDSDTRGGAALSVKAVTGKPIKFCGIGEKVEDFEPFHPDRMASRILGMGDMLTLIEKAQKNFDVTQAEKMERRFKENKFDLDDYLEQNHEAGFDPLSMDRDNGMPEQRMEVIELKETLADAINKLPEKERTVVSLYYYEELTLKEISMIMKVSESRISQLHTKAILRMRGKLERLKSAIL